MSTAKYPDTAAAKKAKEYIDEYSSKLDRSGIVGFYLGTMLTTTWAAYSIPLILDTDSGIVLGTTGIRGVASGIYTSWLLSRSKYSRYQHTGKGEYWWSCCYVISLKRPHLHLR